MRVSNILNCGTKGRNLQVPAVLQDEKKPRNPGRVPESLSNPTPAVNLAYAWLLHSEKRRRCAAPVSEDQRPVQLQFLKISGQCSSSFWRSAASAAPVSEYQRPVQLCSNSWRSVPLFLDEHYPTRRAWVDTQVAEHNTSAWSVADHCTSYLAVQIKQRYKHRAAQEEKLRISLRQEGHVTDLIVNCGSF
jgi:hypothetical protein